MNMYILDDAGDPVEVVDPHVWAVWMKSADRQVALTKVEDVEVSTVFLGIDHNFRGNGFPILYETMVFTGKDTGQMDRYRTTDEAKVGHNLIVRAVQTQQEMAQLVTIDALAGIVVRLRRI